MIELDERYFGGHRKGQRGRAAAGKAPVFVLLKRGGKVYTKVIPDAKSRTLLPIIESKNSPESIVYTDNFASYGNPPKLYDVLDTLQLDLDEWFSHYNNARTNQGKMCCGRTPMETLLDGKRIWDEKNINQM